MCTPIEKSGGIKVVAVKWHGCSQNEVENENNFFF
jgi:hypothetical protein